MKTLEKRKARKLLGAAFSDPYRILASIALAIGLWFVLNSQVESSVRVTVRLAATSPQRTTAPLTNQLSIELPTEQVVGRRFFDGDNVIETITIQLNGPRHLIDTIEKDNRDNRVDLQVKRWLRADWTNRKDCEFTAADIERNKALEGVRIEMDPRLIRLEVEKITDLPLELSTSLVDLQVDDPESLGKRLRLDTATFSPARAVILGPASSITTFQSRAPGNRPLKARLKGGGSERQITTILELTAAPELGLRLAETPSMTIQVLPVTEVFELEVPLDVDDLALPADLQGDYQPDPATRTKVVRIRAGGKFRARLTSLREHNDKSQLGDFALAYLRLTVWIPPPEAGSLPPPEIAREAILVLVGPERFSVDRNECELDQPETITLRKKKP